MLNEIRNGGVARGDCDDVAILAATLAHSMGFPVRFVLLGFVRGGYFAHVYTEALDRSDVWVEFDVTRPAQFPPGMKIQRRSTRSI